MILVGYPLNTIQAHCFNSTPLVLVWASKETSDCTFLLCPCLHICVILWLRTRHHYSVAFHVAWGYPKDTTSYLTNIIDYHKLILAEADEIDAASLALNSARTY